MSERMAASKQAFRDYLKSFDRTKFGAGSEKDPPTDRFSALDVRKTFQEGQDKGLSKEDSARAVLDYASAVRNRTKMGGGTERELNKLLGYLSDEPIEEEQNVGTPSDVLAPGEYDFGDPNRPGGFAGSYYDYLGAIRAIQVISLTLICWVMMPEAHAELCVRFLITGLYALCLWDAVRS